MLASNSPIFTAIRVIEETLVDDGTDYTPHTAETALRESYRYIQRQIPTLEQEVRELHERLGVYMREGSGIPALQAFNLRIRVDRMRPCTAAEAVLHWWNGKGEDRSVPHRFHTFLEANGPRRAAYAANR